MGDRMRQSREKMQLSETRYLFEALRVAVFSVAETEYIRAYHV